MKVLFTLLAATQLFVSTSARAQGELVVLQAAIDVRDQFVTALQKKDFTEMTHQSMESAVSILANDLRTTFKDQAMAAKLEKAWNNDEGNFYLVGITDLGDHAPLLPQIEDVLKQLSEKYGTIVMTLPVVTDIRTLNFAIPVVFHPRGEWQDPSIDNRIEYRKHFIPFANIVTYYGALLACNYFAARSEQPDLKKLCKPAAEKLQFAMGRYIAPPMSDWIFNQSNKTPNPTKQELMYTSGEDLRKAILGSN